MSFVWRSGTTTHEPTYFLSPRAEFGIRVAISAVFALGVVYFVLITRAFRQYGDAMDTSFQEKAGMLAKERLSDKTSYRLSYNVPWMVPPPLRSPSPRPHSASTGEDTMFPSYASYRAATPVSTTYPQSDNAQPIPVRPHSEPFSPQKIMDLRFQSQDGNEMP